MRASDLIGRVVLDGTGRTVGRVRDLRVPDPAASRGALYLTGLVVGGPGRLPALAHAWGFAEGRAAGPALLRRLFAAELARARYVPVDAVTAWDPVRVAGRLQDHPLLADEVRG